MQTTGKPNELRPGRVVWAVNDPDRVREKWKRIAVAFALLHRKQGVANLVNALRGWLPSGEGGAGECHSWVANSVLAQELGQSEKTIERWFKEARELGVVETELRRTHNETGHITTKRRIFPCRTELMDNAVERHRAEVAAKAATKVNGRRSRTKATAHSKTYPRIDQQPNAARSRPLISQLPTSHPSPHQESGTSINSSSGSENGSSYLELSQTEECTGGSVVVRPFSSTARHILDELSLVGPETHVPQLLQIGRHLWKAISAGDISVEEADRLIPEADDAARRAWVEQHQEFRSMLYHLRKLIQEAP